MLIVHCDLCHRYVETERGKSEYAVLSGYVGWNIYFHKKCFREIAGDEYYKKIFEGPFDTGDENDLELY